MKKIAMAKDSPTSPENTMAVASLKGRPKGSGATFRPERLFLFIL